jgi:hypothetical protein
LAQFDTTEVLALMKRRGFVPSAASGFSNTEFLLAASEAIESDILPKLVKANTKHLIRTEDISIVALTSQYRVPNRSVNNGVYAIWFIDASGGIRRIEEIDAGDIPNASLTTAAGEPRYYSFEGPFITLYPTPNASTGTLRVKYHIRPNRLIAVASCGLISAVGATTVTVSPSMPTSAVGPYDIIRGIGSFEHMGIDLVGTRSGGTVTIPAGIPTGVAIGDYVCTPQETPIPQLPHGLHLPAACRGVAGIVGAKGKKELAAFLLAEAGRIEAEVLSSLVPRNQTAQQDIANPWW